MRCPLGTVLKLTLLPEVGDVVNVDSDPVGMHRAKWYGHGYRERAVRLRPLLRRGQLVTITPFHCDGVGYL